MNHEFEKFKAYVKSELPTDLKQMMDENDATSAQGLISMIDIMKFHGASDEQVLSSIYKALKTVIQKAPEAALEFKIDYEKFIKEKMRK